MPQNYSISFVIPAHNEEAYIGECLKSIFKQIGGGVMGNAEVIVINNASSDGTKAVASSFPGVRVVDEPNKGLTKARQRGLTEAHGEFVAYLDSDSRIPGGWLAIVKREFERDATLVCLSGPCRYFDLAGYRKVLAEGLWRLFAPPAYFLVGYMIYGGNFVAKRNALLAAGGFNTDLYFYGEDTDIAKRLYRVGKVKFLMPFFVYGSGRRLRAQGIIRTELIYGMNFLWEVLFHKPFTHPYKDIR